MRNLHNPKWIFIINTIPIVVLFFFFNGEFNIIKSLLKEENINLWKIFGCTLGILGVFNFLYGVYLTVRKENVSVIYGFLALLCYIPFLYLYSYHSDEIIPFSIPQWMVPGNMFLYVGTFLMPTLIYSLFILVAHFTPGTEEHSPGKNFSIALVIPLAWYLFSQVLLPLWKPLDDEFGVHAVIVFVIAGTVIFLFFLVRGIFILATKKANAWKKYQLFWKIPVSILLPLLGLAVNNGHLFSNFAESGSGIFGDFSSYWFYALALVNGIFICLPALENKRYRILLFIGRCMMFAYTFYFFLVFLPFLPLSILAIVAVGTGFLMLTPLLLFVIHVNELSKDFLFLKNYFSNNQVKVVSILSFLILPVVITAGYLEDKRVLNETLGYLYTPDYSKKYNINKRSLQKTLEVIKYHKEGNRGNIFGNHIPYLSPWFNWLVLDNLTLSDSKINTIEKVFFGSESIKLRPDIIRNENVKITNFSTKSTYDKSQNAWISWVDLEITNSSNNTRASEYATVINLPAGCWISDYYLYVGDKKEMGILAEKKTAVWVYSQIRNERKDPGILFYLTGNKVAFRVFPFAKDEIRKTGIAFFHKEPVKLSIDDHLIDLGNEEQIVSNEPNTSDNVIYISSNEKKMLKQVHRKPYFHFIMDVSKSKVEYSGDFKKRIKKVLEGNKELAANAQISFVNSYVTSFPLNSDWEQKYQSQIFEGGFFMDRAIKTTLFNSYNSNSNSYPVIVVVTDSIKHAILENDFSDFKMAFPESDVFFNLIENGALQPHSLTANSVQQLPDSVQPSPDQTVLEYKFKDNSIAYLPDNDQPSIILKNEDFDITETEIKEKNWQSALMMQGKWLSQILHPEKSDKEWLSLVKYSFMSKVMTPVTSYIVVENEAQKAILKKKQEQVLSSNKSLDLGSETLPMTEPGLIIMGILLGLVLWYRKKRMPSL